MQQRPKKNEILENLALVAKCVFLVMLGYIAVSSLVAKGEELAPTLSPKATIFIAIVIEPQPSPIVFGCSTVEKDTEIVDLCPDDMIEYDILNRDGKIVITLSRK